VSAVHNTRAKPLEFKLVSEFFHHGMDRLVAAEARVLDDEEGIALVDILFIMF
jgi:hypothetical protein